MERRMVPAESVGRGLRMSPHETEPYPYLKSMQEKTNKMTSVNTTYARIVLILLAVNLLFTGYVVTRITSTSEAQQVTVPAKVQTADESPLATE
tara:strand:- start:133 stop:414 length:282 start_codon:yes stop_codon:yes gene_type:complete